MSFVQYVYVYDKSVLCVMCVYCASVLEVDLIGLPAKVTKQKKIGESTPALTIKSAGKICSNFFQQSAKLAYC